MKQCSTVLLTLVRCIANCTAYPIQALCGSFPQNQGLGLKGPGWRFLTLTERALKEWRAIDRWVLKFWLLLIGSRCLWLVRLWLVRRLLSLRRPLRRRCGSFPMRGAYSWLYWYVSWTVRPILSQALCAPSLRKRVRSQGLRPRKKSEHSSTPQGTEKNN